MARPTPGRTQFHYLESWLLPGLGLRASVFHFNPGYERDQDYYLDVATVTTGAQRWQTEDHYLDLVVRTGRETEIVDVDELLAAHQHGLMSAQTAEQVLRTAIRAIDGLATHGHDLNAWLAGTGVHLSWR
jgi:predicted RNA-binding protein associated with RNAse of E/G family